jgi:hypothetical protein
MVSVLPEDELTATAMTDEVVTDEDVDVVDDPEDNSLLQDTMPRHRTASRPIARPPIMSLLMFCNF